MTPDDPRAKTEALFGRTFSDDGTLRAVSPTQYSTFSRCGLRWHFDKKHKLPRRAPGKGALIGGKGHKLIERFLLTGEDVRGPLEMVGAAMLEPYLWAAPFNKGPGIVEGPLLDPRLQTPGGVLITGYYDYYIPGALERWPTVIDHKFKKSLDKWAPTAEELPDDPQAIVYPQWVLTREPQAPGVLFRHHNVQTEGEGGRYALPVEIRVTRDDVLRRWGAMAKVIDGPMRAAALVPAVTGQTAEGIPYDTEACGDFGGCDFARICKHSPTNRYLSAMRGTSSLPAGLFGIELPGKSQSATTSKPFTGESVMGLLSQIGVTTAVPVPEVPALLAVVPVSQCKSGGVYMLPGGPVGTFEGMIGSRPIFRLKDGTLKDLETTAEVRDLTADPVANPPAVVAPAVVDPPKRQRTLLLTNEEKAQLPAVAPPDVAETTQAAGLTHAAAVAAPEVQVTTAEAITQSEKPKRGRPTKAEAEAKAALAAAVAPAETVPAAPAQTPVQSTPGNVSTPGKSPLTLLINVTCPQATDLAPYVAKLAAALASKHGAPDVRLGQKQSDLAFGGWKALLALTALANPPTGLCTIQSGELADPVIEALAPVAAVVGRGSR